jgi:choline dehydrogenase-like flavoprotein
VGAAGEEREVSGAILELDDVSGKKLVEDSADVVIVGTGAGGATAARVLAEAGLDLILIEEGPKVTTSELRSDMYTAFKRFWRDMGFQVAEGRAFTPVLQGRCIGGTTVINGAIMHRMPEAIHAAWRDDYGVSDVLSYEALTRVYDQLDRELHVGPAPEPVVGNNSALMRAGVEKLGLRGNLIRRNVDGCRGSAHCNQGCPTARKQSMDVSYVPRAVAAGARVYATCRADRVRVQRKRATGVEATFRDPLGRREGPKLRVHARHGVILAASAIQTPLLLQASAIGRPSRLVGQRLQTHPGSGMMGVFDKPVEAWFGATQGYETTHYWSERMKFESVGMPLEVAAARLPGLGTAAMKEMIDFGHVGIWGVQVRAEAHGSVRQAPFGGAKIAFDMTTADLERLKLGLFRVAEMMFAAGAREVMPAVHGLPDRVRSVDEMKKVLDVPADPRHFHCIAAHLFGTALMGRGASSSVVAPDGQVHDVKDLYVADSSVFPTNMGVNPQHTICAVAWLFAERLADRISRA